MRFSIIIPTLNEEEVLGGTLAAVFHDLEVGDEVFVVDGGSGDGTPGIAAAAGAILVESPRGRGNQMNAGAAQATGDILVFVHADTLLPPGFREGLVSAFSEIEIGWGRFDLVFDQQGFVLGLIAKLISHRSRWTGGATGDQAIFVRRTLFRSIGGFAEPFLFEDVDLCRRLKRKARMGVPSAPVVTSSRRWRTGGLWRTVFLMWGLKSAYLLGVPSSRLRHWYRDSR